MNTKDCYKVVQHVKPNAYSFAKEDDTNVLLPREWDNLPDDAGMNLLACSKTSVI